MGPALFLLYVNDLPNMISESETVMFADDTKLYKEIRSTDDEIALQMDLNNIGSWSTESGLKFNETKSHHQSIKRRIKPLSTAYDMNGAMLEKTSHERDLGVWVSIDLTWNCQVLEQCSRANKLLGFAKRNTRHKQNTSVRRSIYLTILRPHLGLLHKFGHHNLFILSQI